MAEKAFRAACPETGGRRVNGVRKPGAARRKTGGAGRKELKNLELQRVEGTG